MAVSPDSQPQILTDPVARSKHADGVDPASPAPLRPDATPDAAPHGGPDRTRTIALINQKGGVGKTTTTANLGAALADSGHRVLLVDLDPQAQLTLHVGVDSQAVQHTTYDLMIDSQVTVEQVIHKVSDRLSLLPSEVNLAGIEAELAPKMITGRAQHVLKQKCEGLLRRREWEEGKRRSDPPRRAGSATERRRGVEGVSTNGDLGGERPGKGEADGDCASFDYVLIDCPPSLGLLTVNALTMAGEVIVPMQAQFLALQGLSKLLETVSMIQQSFNPQLCVSGIVVCMHESQTILAGEVMADLTAFLESARGRNVPWSAARVLSPPVRRNIKLAECPSFGRTIFNYAPTSHGAEDYRRLAESVVQLGTDAVSSQRADSTVKT